MAFNDYMHPRNIYRTRPDFQQLAKDYPGFGKYVKTDSKGKVSVDFKNAGALRTLTEVCLKNDFKLDVKIPENRLVPTLPSRLNYILWIEDLLSITPDVGSGNVRGIDIGTGACSIYPLLGCTKNGWSFLATEIDEMSIQSANSNISRNNLENKITVYKSTEGGEMIPSVVKNGDRPYDFVMCNPPFYHSRSDKDDPDPCSARSPPAGINTGSDHETIVDGGEVEFVKKIILDSRTFKDDVKIFTSLVGKKCSLRPLKDELELIEVSSYVVTEFFQGNTVRWGLAWTYLKDVDLKQVTNLKKKKVKPKLPMMCLIPDNEPTQTLTQTKEFILEILKDLRLDYGILKETAKITVLKIVANENTWSHQRKKRRQRKRLEQEKSTESENLHVSSFDDVDAKRKHESCDDEPCPKLPKMDDRSKDFGESSECVLACTMIIKITEFKRELELQWTGGTSGRDAMHQLLQYIKNRM